MSSAQVQPWYREPWPWLLMLGPALVLVAGAFTAWIAVAARDPLVAEDYYKQGLAINRDLARERRAEEQGLSARLELRGDTLRVQLSGAVAPEVIFLFLAHGTRPELDQRLRLVHAGGGSYELAVAALEPARWRYVLSDARDDWRLSGSWATKRESKP